MRTSIIQSQKKRPKNGRQSKDGGSGSGEEEEKKRTPSVIRDGYEIFILGDVIVNGKKKKKVKKRKLSQSQLEKHNQRLKQMSAKKNNVKGMTGIDIESEIRAINQLQKQNNEIINRK